MKALMELSSANRISGRDVQKAGRDARIHFSAAC